MRNKRKAMLKQVDVYPVTCERLSAGRTNLEVLDAVIRGGAGMIQLREKDRSPRDFYELALKFREVTSSAGVLLIINDHTDIALAVRADGVHLGQDDLPAAAARRIAPDLLIGVSTHSADEALKAQKDGADYVNIGPVFPTKTKEGADKFLGPDVISAVGPLLDIPFTVMGGINESNIDLVLAAGARRIAMVTAITEAPDIAGAVTGLKQKIRRYSG